MPQILSYYYTDGSYYDMPIGEIELADNPDDVLIILGIIGLLVLSALIGYTLSSQ